ncbi:MAG: flagellar hook-associated protein FlgL [Pirellulaceae bacterium]
MYARATAFAVTSRAQRYTSRHGADIIRLQQQISSGMKLTKPSDNPLAFRQASALQGQLQSLELATDVIADATTKLNISVSNLTEFSNILSSAKRLAQQGAQSVDQSERNALAIEAEQLLVRLEQISNSQYADQYLYGGTRSDTKPFSFAPPKLGSGVLQTSYAGSERLGKSVVGPGVSVETLYDGNNIFSDYRRGETLVLGNTGVQPGAGTDTMIGRASLQVRHDTTSFAAGSGIATGSSTDSDNIIGPAGRHWLTINDTSGTGSAGTITLNDGHEIKWDSSMTDLAVVSDEGDVVHVDMSAITAGFSGTVDITSTGTISIDEGLTTTAIDFSASQVITDSTTSRYTHLDTSAVYREGDGSMEFQGTSDAFQSVFELIQDLRGSRGLTGVELTNALNRRMADIDHMATHVLEVVGVQSASLAALENLDGQNENLKFEVESQLSNLQSTDISEAVLRLQNAQMLQEFTYTVTSQIMSQSLINFLR